MGFKETSHTRIGFLVEAYFAALRRRNKAPNTITRWRPELRRFVDWAGERELYEISAADLDQGYLTAWEEGFRERNGRDPAPNTTRAAIQAITSFYSWLERFDYLVDAEQRPFRNPARALEAPVIRPAAELDWLRREEDEALLLCSMTGRETILVYFLRLTGLRLNESLTLTNRDVDLASNQIVVRSSKTVAGFRTLPIPPELRPRIESWLSFTRFNGWHHPDGPFLVTRNRTPMAPQYVEAALARVGKRAGLHRKLTPHTLRRTFGSDLLNRGARLEVVSRALGHASSVITEKAYARLEDHTIHDEMLKALSA